MDRSPRQKSNKNSRALNDSLDPMDVEGIYRAFHPNTTEYSFFPCAHGTFSRIDQILSHISSLNWYQEIGIIPWIFSDNIALKLELNHKRKFERNSNTWSLKTILLNNEWVNEEIKEEFKNSQKLRKGKHSCSKGLGYSKGNRKKEIHGNTKILQKM